MEFEFETEIDTYHLNYTITAKVTYTAEPSQKEGRYFTRYGHEIWLKDASYSIYGQPFDPEGQAWQRLERICQERAEEHFTEIKEAI